MHIVLLKFAQHKAQAPQHMAAHKAWLQRGFDDGVFLLAGSLQGGQGGVVLAHRSTTGALTQRVNQDPFVIEGVVQAEIVGVEPNRATEHLRFLLPEAVP